MASINVNSYIKKILIINGIGDIIVGIMLLFFLNQLAVILSFPTMDEISYLSGGWGIAAISFGLLRLFAGLQSDFKLMWFVAIFGVIEGTILTIFGFVIDLTTSLTFVQVSMSTLFALFFAVTYGLGFILRQTQKNSA